VITICIVFISCFQFCKAQNLIPDSSFENNKILPTDFSSFNSSYTWSTPSQGTTDLFCKCSLRKTAKYSMVNVPQNPMGYQEANSGTCYAGFFAHSHGAYREYLQTPLKESLEKNKTYLFTMYISLADYSRAAIEQLGVCFLADKVEYNSFNVITNLNPTYIKLESTITKKIEEWHEVSVKYKARGGERYILIGSFETGQVLKTKFKMPKDIKSHINQKYDRDAYYFIDDVSLVETIGIEEPIIPIQFEPAVETEIHSDTLFAFKNVLFQTNKTTLLPSSYSELDVIADYLNKNKKDKRAARASVFSTDEVNTQTTLIQFRVRNVIREVGQQHEMVSEEMFLWGYKQMEQGIEALDIDECKRLLHTANAIDISETRQKLLFESELKHFEELHPDFIKVVEARSNELVEAHMRFAKYLGAKRFEAVTPVLPPDILGVYVLIPNPKI
jgi:hypothetical protein